MENTYENAYAEILEVLKYLSKEEFINIPKEEFEFFEKNKNNNYIFSFDPNNPILLRKTYIIFVSLYKKYIASSEQLDGINKILKKNILRQNNKLNTEFKFHNKISKENNNISLIEIKKENWLKTFFNKLKGFFRNCNF